MSVFVAAIATESGVPLFSKKRGVNEGMQFSTLASLHGVNMFSKCHDVTILQTAVPNGSLVWKSFNKSITLIGIVTGGFENELPSLLSLVFDAMVLAVGRPELDNFESTEQLKRDLRPCLPLIDYLLESLDPSAISANRPTLFLDLMECSICPEAAQLQRILENYCEQVGGRWACLSVESRLVATSSDWLELDAREARLLLLLSSQPGAPLTETCVYLPYTSPNIAFRCICCKLLANVYVLVICGATPPLSQIDSTVLRVWEGSAQVLRDIKRTYPRNLPLSVHIEAAVLGILIVKIKSNKCVISRSLHASGQNRSKALSGAHRLDILRTFYITSARDLISEYTAHKDNDETDVELYKALSETYWCSEFHKCYAVRSDSLLCCTLFAATIPTHTARIMTTQLCIDFANNNDVFW